MKTLGHQFLVGVVNQNGDAVCVLRPAIGIVGVDGADDLGARNSVRTIRDQINDALAHGAVHNERGRKWPAGMSGKRVGAGS